MDKCKNKKCIQTKICNPKSGICVNKNGKIGRRISAIPEITSKQIKIRKNINELMDLVLTQFSTMPDIFSKENKNVKNESELIEKFCKTKDIEWFFKLSEKTQKLMYDISEYLLKDLALDFKKHTYVGMGIGKRRRDIIKEIKSLILDDHRKTSFLGLIYIIYSAKNTEIPYKITEKVYGVQQTSFLYSFEYKTKILIIDDNHTKIYNCNRGTERAQSVSDYIKYQISSATSFIDLFLETPYLSKETAHNQAKIGNTFMADIQKTIPSCFSFGKSCSMLNLRGHYIDLRHKLDESDKKNDEYNKYFELMGFISNMYYQGKSSYHIEDTFIEKNQIDDALFKKIFKSGKSLELFMRDLLYNKTKYIKQFDNIEDEKIKETVKYFEKEWLKISGNKYVIKITYKYFKENYFDKISNNIEENKKLFTPLYDLFSSYNAGLMDCYAIARFFRTYRDVKNVNSGRARNLILFNGGFHNNRYKDFFLKLGFEKEIVIAPYYSGKKIWKNCKELYYNKPLFRSNNAPETVPYNDSFKKSIIPHFYMDEKFNYEDDEAYETEYSPGRWASNRTQEDIDKMKLELEKLKQDENDDREKEEIRLESERENICRHATTTYSFEGPFAEGKIGEKVYLYTTGLAGCCAVVLVNDLETDVRLYHLWNDIGQKKSDIWVRSAYEAGYKIHTLVTASSVTDDIEKLKLIAIVNIKRSMKKIGLESSDVNFITNNFIKVVLFPEMRIDVSSLTLKDIQCVPDQ
jgi:hypothetical protein